MFNFIRSYVQAHRSALKLSYHNLSQAPVASLVTIVAIGLCLSLPFGLMLITKNVEKFCAGWDKVASITIYLKAQSTPEQLAQITDTVKSFTFVGSVQVISAETALQEFQTVSGLKDIVSLLPHNPLPAVMQIQLTHTAITPAQFTTFKAKLQRYHEIEQIDFDQAWVRKLDLLLSFGKALSQFLYGVVGLGVLFVIANTIRLSLEQHRDEMEVLHLIGATKAFIRRPFLYRGALYGWLSGLVTAVILGICMLYFKTPTRELTRSFDASFSLDYLVFSDILIILGTSTLLGWIGAWLAFIQQHSALQYSRSNIY